MEALSYRDPATFLSKISSLSGPRPPIFTHPILTFTQPDWKMQHFQIWQLGPGWNFEGTSSSFLDLEKDLNRIHHFVIFTIEESCLVRQRWRKGQTNYEGARWSQGACTQLVCLVVVTYLVCFYLCAWSQLYLVQVVLGGKHISCVLLLVCLVQVVLGPSCTWWQAHTHLEIRAEHKRAAILVALSTR